MLALAGQTAGPNGLTFCEGTLYYPRGNSKIKIFLKNKKKMSRASPGISVSYILIGFNLGLIFFWKTEP